MGTCDNFAVKCQMDKNLFRSNQNRVTVDLTMSRLQTPACNQVYTSPDPEEWIWYRFGRQIMHNRYRLDILITLK